MLPEAKESPLSDERTAPAIMSEFISNGPVWREGSALLTSLANGGVDALPVLARQLDVQHQTTGLGVEFDAALRPGVGEVHPVTQVLQDMEVQLEKMGDFYPHARVLVNEPVAAAFDRVTDGSRRELNYDFILDLGSGLHDLSDRKITDVLIDQSGSDAKEISEEGTDGGEEVGALNWPQAQRSPTALIAFYLSRG